MITLVEALNYRCLRYVARPLDRFHVLVGPNASGKTTFFDVVGFIGRLLRDGLDSAMRDVSPDPRDLVFGRQGGTFGLAVECQIPKHLRSDRMKPSIRYEVTITVDDSTARPSISAEQVQLVAYMNPWNFDDEPRLFPSTRPNRTTLFSRNRGDKKSVVSKNPETGKDNYYPEVKDGRGGGWVPSFQLGSQKSAFANLPEDESRFPIATWFKEYLSNGIQQLVLNSLDMRKASAPGQTRQFKTDGTNLPWVVADFRAKHPTQFEDWVRHLGTALPDLIGVDTVERPDTRHRHIELIYSGGLTVPSWMASDGTLRLLALTLPAYLPELTGVFLIEEPENGIHPKAIETVFQSLSNVPEAQVLLATHSPVILSLVEPRQVLCFAKDDVGATDVIPGNEHPALADWQNDPNLGIMFAAGVLG